MKLEYIIVDDFDKDNLEFINEILKDAISAEHAFDKSCNRLHIFAFYE